MSKQLKIKEILDFENRGADPQEKYLREYDAFLKTLTNEQMRLCLSEIRLNRFQVGDPVGDIKKVKAYVSSTYRTSVLYYESHPVNLSNAIHRAISEKKDFIAYYIKEINYYALKDIETWKEILKTGAKPFNK